MAKFQSTPSVWRVTLIFVGITSRKNISIHTLRVEGDVEFLDVFNVHFAFQSTPSVWRVTAVAEILNTISCISIHTLRVEGDDTSIDNSTSDLKFQSTPSVWRVTSCLQRHWFYRRISIHTLRVEGDVGIPSPVALPNNFNPHPPCGGWPEIAMTLLFIKIFQSTPSVWRVT